jgi:hypothetical protein
MKQLGPTQKWDISALLGPDLARRGGYIAEAEARSGRLGRYALQQQAVADNVRSSSYGQLGMPGPMAMPQLQGGLGPFSDPVTGAFKMPDRYRATLRAAGMDPETLEQTVNRNLLERQGADYQTRLLYGQQAGKPPTELGQAKEALFSKVARMIEADPSQRDRVLQAAFTGPNAQSLLAEFDAKMAKDAHDSPLDKILGLGSKAAQVPVTAIGQMLSGLGGARDVVGAAIGTLTGARNADGSPVTLAQTGREAADLPKDFLNVLSMGALGLVGGKQARSTSTAPGVHQIAKTMRTQGRGDDIAQLLVPFLGPTRFAQAHAGDDSLISKTFGFLGDVATDPTTYLTFGFGGLGTSATRAAGNVAFRSRFLKQLGVGDDIAQRFSTAPESMWEPLVADLRGEFGDAAIREANDVANAFRIGAETAHGSKGWAGYKGLLAEHGIDADALVPRGFVKTGREGKLAVQLAQSRGGVSLRGGVPGLRGFVNLKTGTGASRGLRPMGAWFQGEGNRFHQLSSKTLDNVSQVFHYGGGADREFVHNNKGLFNATMTSTTLGRGVQHRFDDLGRETRAVEDRLGRWLKREPENATRLVDVIEKGDRSDYYTLVPRDVLEGAEKLSTQLDQARNIAAEHGVDIATLREIADDSNAMLRYFPHKVIASIGEKARFPVTPTAVGASKARTVRAGSRITGPQGTTAMLSEGSFAEIQDVTRRILGEGILDTDPIKTVQAYIASVGNAAALTRTYRALTEAGLLVPDVSDLAPGVIRGAGDPVRAIWEQPGERAQRAVTEAQAAVGRVSEDVRLVMRERAVGLSREAELQAELAVYAARHADADSRIGALSKSRAEREQMLAIATRDFKAATAEAKRTFAATKREMTTGGREELRGVRGAKQLLHRQLGQLVKQHEATLAELERGYRAQQEVLSGTPQAIKTQLLSELDTLARQAVGGHRPWRQAIGELKATRHRLAQVEGGELAAGQRNQLYERAIKGTLGKRGAPIARQRAATQQAADLNEQIAEASRVVRAKELASDEAGEQAARGVLTDLMTKRAEALKTAELATKEAAELYDIVDQAEAAMRVAELREGEVLAHEAGAIMDAQIGRMSEHVRKPLARLLQVHAADLVAESNEILAMAPRLKFLNRALREFSTIDTSVPAIPQTGTGRALGDLAQEYMRKVEGRADEMLKSWEAAVGDENKAFSAAHDEFTRQWSALLARENALQEQAARAKTMDPAAQALVTHQREGDQINLFEAELNKNENELEWWLNNRDEVRKTQTLKAIQLGEAVKGNEVLSRSLGAAQRLLDSDSEAASIAMTRLVEDPRIFNLMAPEVEHLAAVVGKLPFMEGGAAMPREVSNVLDRVMHKGPDSHTAFLKVMNMFNTRWKRLVLASPGSVFRRWFGNTYNAIVLAGVSPTSFGKAMDAIIASRHGKTLDKIADPSLRRYMELAMEQNIFEGQLAALATETEGFKTGRHIVQRAEEMLQTAALTGEDVARLAQFIDGLDAGMGPAAARLWTGKYHFFNNELTQAERNGLRPLYPFYAYIKNNFALQFYTLFHQPGKISAYGHAMRDLGAEPEGQTAPGWIEQSGGFPIGGKTWLQNTLIDTSPLGAVQTITGVGQRGQQSGWSPTDVLSGDLVGSLSPLLTTGISAATGVDPTTGQKMYPQDLGPAASPIAGALRALGFVNEANQWNPRALAAIQGLTPLAARAGRLGGGLTPAQAEQTGPYALGFFGGPNIRRQGDRQARSDFLQRGRVLDSLIGSQNAQGNTVPTSEDLTQQERTKRAIQALMGG